MTELSEVRGPPGSDRDAQVRAIVEAIPVPAIITNLSDGRILYGNWHLADAAGIPLPELMGRRTTELYNNPAARKAIMERLRKHGHARNCEVSVRGPDGSVRWLLVSSELIAFAGEEAIMSVFYDMTERKNREEALRLSDKVLRRIPDSIILTDRYGTIIRWLGGARDIFGYREEEAIGKHVSFIHAGVEGADITREIAEAIRGEGTFSAEIPCVRKDGSEIIVEADIGAIHDEDGAPWALVAVMRDKTERRRRRETLMRWGHVFEHAEWGIAVASADGKTLEITNPAFARMHGYTVEELLGRPADLVFASHLRDQAAEFARLTRETGHHVYESEHVRKDGTTFPVLVDATAVKDAKGRVLHCIANVQDITVRKKTEDALRRSEERYRALYDDNPSMYFTVDEAGTVLSVNRFGAEQLGYVPEELTGRSVLAIFYADDREEVQKLLEECLLNPDQIVQRECRKVRKDGSLMWVKEAARAVSGSHNEMMILLVCEDVTERKRAEEVLEEMREELESKVESQIQEGSAYDLTFRELSVLHLVAAGKPDRDIGALLGISPRTVNKHIEKILQKMNASSRTEAGVRAIREGILE